MVAIGGALLILMEKRRVRVCRDWKQDHGSGVPSPLDHYQVYFTIYEQLQGLLGSDGNHRLSIGANMLAASGDGAATTIVTNPLGVYNNVSKSKLSREHLTG